MTHSFYKGIKIKNMHFIIKIIYWMTTFRYFYVISEKEIYSNRLDILVQQFNCVILFFRQDTFPNPYQCSLTDLLRFYILMLVTNIVLNMKELHTHLQTTTG